MLGNFSIGDYFKQGAVEFAWELSLNGFGFDPEQIWITVFEGDDELGLGPDEEAIAALGGGRRAALAHRPVPALGELLAGRARPARAARARSCTSTAASTGAAPTTCRAARTSASSSSGTSCSCSTTRTRSATLTPLPTQNIDTGLGLNRMAVDPAGHRHGLRDRPVPAARRSSARSCPGRTYGESFEVDRALRILADHTRGMTFLVADGVVPSNEDRGYVLRRIMRRAIQQGRTLGIEGTFLPRFCRAGHRAHGRRVPGAARAARVDREVAARGGGVVRPHARAGHADAVGDRRAGPGERRGGRRRRRPLPAARHVRLPVRPLARAARPGGPGLRRGGLRDADGRAARALALGPGRQAPRGARRLRLAVRRGRVARADPLHGVRHARAGDRGHADRLRERARRGEARRVAVLRGGRRADQRRGRHRVRRRGLPRAGGRRGADRRRPGGARRTRARRAAARRAGLRARGPRHAAGDDGQPHRDPPAACRAARASGGPRPPGRLLRRAGQAALRLHPRPG